jgi:hypothetical protein
MSRKVRWCLFVMLALASAALAQRVESLYRTAKISQSDVAVSCRSGALPEAHQFGQVVILSCKQ